MTLAGTLTATGVLFALILAAGAFGWSQVVQTSVWVVDNHGRARGHARSRPGEHHLDPVVDRASPPWSASASPSSAIFKPKLAKFGAPLYALGYGVALGAISAVYNNSFDGIVVQAVLATLGVFFVMFLLYATRIIKVTPRFVMVVVAATGGIFVMYLVGWIASLFGADIMFWNEPSPLGIGISVVIVIVAALNLALDFDFIEKAVEAAGPCLHGVDRRPRASPSPSCGSTSRSCACWRCCASDGPGIPGAASTRY